MKNDLRGYVINLGDAGVEIIVEGSKKDIEKFLVDVEENAPEVSDIEDIITEYQRYIGKFKKFIIDKSKTTGKCLLC